MDKRRREDSELKLIEKELSGILEKEGGGGYDESARQILVDQTGREKKYSAIGKGRDVEIEE